MNKILISINPEFVKQILAGSKRYEYRTKVAKRDIDAMIIYCTFPTMAVLAEAEISEVLEMRPADLWEKTKEYSGISKEFFDRYFRGRSIAYAYKLGRIVAFKKAKPLSAFGCKSAPQSFVYISE